MFRRVICVVVLGICSFFALDTGSRTAMMARVAAHSGDSEVLMTERCKDTRQITAGRDEKLTKHNLFETPRFFADVYVARPGQSQRLHRHASEDKCYFVLSGVGTVTSGDTRYEVEPGQIVWCAAGEEHGVENAAEAAEDLRLLVFMAPHPRLG